MAYFYNDIEKTNSYGESRKELQFKIGKIIGHVILAIFVLSVVFGSFGTVEAGSRGIKTRFSAVVGVIDPGLYFKVPFFEDVKQMDVRTQTISYDDKNSLSGASKDLQDVSVSVVVNYRIDPTQAPEIFKQYRSTENYNSTVIQPMVRDSIKAATSQYTAEELVTKRAEFNEKATSLLTQRLEGKLVVLERVNITNLNFSNAFTEAIEAKVTAVQKAEAEKNKLEQVKYEAQQQIETAKAQAETIRIQAQAINAQGGADYVRLKALEKWNGAGCTSYCGLEASNGILITR